MLFLCTGNYFRSRFAQLLLARRAGERGLPIVTDSAGLAESCSSRNAGPISPHTLAGLAARGLPVPAARAPRDVTAAELDAADLVIALKEAEHRPMVEQRFPDHAAKVRYWHVHDIDLVAPEAALAEVERLVEGLLDELAQDR